MEYKNILDQMSEFYQFCKENGWTDENEEFDDWYNNGRDLQFFEGDPDMIKVDGETGFFCQIGETVWYWFDDFESNAEMMLRKFFSTFKTGITLGCESWVSGINPDGVVDITENHWETWKKMETGIAYRGGAGYSYWISDWSEWLENERKKSAEQIHAEYFAA